MQMASKVFLILDVAAFEQTFKGWMVDIGTDDVHLTIDLPSAQGKGNTKRLKIFGQACHAMLCTP